MVNVLRKFRHMKIRFYPTQCALMLLLFSFAGCGHESSNATSPFAGRWDGSWMSAETTTSGAASNSSFAAGIPSGSGSLLIYADGNVYGVFGPAVISGTVPTTGIYSTANIFGTVTDSGNANLTYYYSDVLHTATGTFTINYTGSSVSLGSVHLIGTLDEYFGSTSTGSRTFDLIKEIDWQH